MEYKHYTLEDFSDITASNAAAPGGGSISAMSSSFGAALVSMAARLTENKKGYEEVQEEMKEVIKLSEPLRLELLDDIEKDSRSFDLYMQALKLPKSTEEEKQERRNAMQEALKKACEVPLSVAQKSIKVLELAKIVCEKANRNAASDALSGAFAARSGCMGAVQNVLINSKGVKDEAFVQDMQDKCSLIVDKAHKIEEECMRLANI
ncbi:MAG: cyclodeaminase/cyclohydrolase family protein [Eubacteriales bacterium]|nr:cyclodeaminase/cyclohydrolase family protein [Eubacteriales bacterium]